MLTGVSAWFARPMVFIWTAYFSALELLSWLLASAPGCLISPDQDGHTGENNNQQGCPTFFGGLLILLFRADRFIEHHDKSIVAVFTVVLAISTIGLWISTYHLWGAGERQIELNRNAFYRQLRAMTASTSAANASADIADRQLKITRLQYFAAHRPKLRVRHVSIVTAEEIGHPTIFFSHGAEIKGALVIVNIGGSKAKIIDSRYRIYFTKGTLPVDILEEGYKGDLLLPEQVLDIGESCATPISDTIIMEPEGPDGVDLREFQRGNWVIYVIGQIRYQDEAGSDRFMGFCRRWGDDGRFRAVDDPDYEYED
jgi:hypothetical protein